MEEETLTSRKGDTWGSEAASERGGAPGAQNLAALCWGRGVTISAQEMAPPGSGPSAEPAPRPPQALAPAPLRSCGPHEVVGVRCL